MHYIRFLRPPEVQAGRAQASVKIVLTITTDLSDSLLSPRRPIQLAVVGACTEHKADGQAQLIPVSLTQSSSSPPTWRAGMRVLKLELPLPAQQPIDTIQIRPLSRQLTALATADVCPAAAASQGLIMAVYADIARPGDAMPPPRVCFRSLRLPLPPGDTAATTQALQIEEDLGESIARHIWDAGIVAVSLIASMCLENAARSSSETPLPILHGILHGPPDRPLDVLELGCGVGVLGIGLARILSAARASGETTRILMTDLPEAEQRARANMARQSGALAGRASVSLDFEPLDWEDGMHGRFGEKARSRAWDLVALCDCTYNTDTLPPLVKTLSELQRHSVRHGPDAGGPVKAPDVLVATKPRHSSERIFFDLMAADGWFIWEQTVLPLPVLDGEGQTVEVYLFGKQVGEIPAVD